MKKHNIFIGLALLFLFGWPTAAFAAPLSSVALAEGVNLPGWLGAVLTLLALALIVGLWLWLSRQWGNQ